MTTVQVNDWENPQVIGRNKEPAHATLVPYADAATALVAGSRIWYYNLYLPLCDLGHDVVRFDYDLSAHTRNRDVSVPAQRAFVAQNRPRLEKALLEQIERAHQERPVDLFFSYF